MRIDADDQSVGRVADLGRRLAALEPQHSSEVKDSAAPRHREVSVLDGDQFWAVTGLRERIGEHGAVLFTGSVTLPGETA
jgi:hypothetical protein